MVKPAAPAVMAAGLYAGTTLADDGRPILLLDPVGHGQAGRHPLRRKRDRPRLCSRRAAEAEAARETTLLLFRTLDGGRRAVPVALVERIEDVPAEAIGFSAGRLRVALGGRILPLAGCDAAPETGKLRILRLTDGASEVAYGFAEVIDIRALALDLEPAAAPGRGRRRLPGRRRPGRAARSLLAVRRAWRRGAEPTSAPPVCALPEGDPWIDNMLRPLIESLGYRIAAPGDGATPTS